MVYVTGYVTSYVTKKNLTEERGSTRRGKITPIGLLTQQKWVGINKVFSPRYVVKFKQVKLLFFSKLKMVKSERDVVAEARFYNFNWLQIHYSFDWHKTPTYRWRPTHRLLAARFSADLEQLQNRDFSTSNRSKPIRVLTRKYRHLIPFYPHPRLPAAPFPADLKHLFRTAAAAAAATTRKREGRHEGGKSRP